MVSVIVYLLLFLKNTAGIIQKPYETYRALAKNKQIGQIIPLFLLVFLYFGFATLVQKGVRTHPFLLTLSFSKISLGFMITFFLITISLFLLGKIFGGSGSLKNLVLPWSYTLWPTIIWFFATSVFYILFPPPRTTSLLGQIFSVLFLIFSFFLFFWKFVLYYLTLRFGLKMDLVRIVGMTVVLIPLLFLYSLMVYKMGIFRIPFV